LQARPEYIVVGRFGRPHGVSGEIYITPISDNPSRFRRKSGKFWIETETGWKEITVRFQKGTSERPLVIIEGVVSPEEARKYSNELIYIKTSSLEKLPEGRYYHFELVDCRVTDREGMELGQVTAVEEYPANNVLVIRSGKGTVHLFPMVKQFLKSIDIENKLIVVEPPEGIF
jgi:16S rRNA processing protein RimM